MPKSVHKLEGEVSDRIQLIKVVLYSAVGGFHLGGMNCLISRPLAILIAIMCFGLVVLKVSRLWGELAG
jgi:hypothetical protein